MEFRAGELLQGEVKAQFSLKPGWFKHCAPPLGHVVAKDNTCLMGGI